MRLQAIRRKVDITDSVVANEEINDLGQFFPERRFAAAEPKVRKWWRGSRQPHDLVPRQVALLIELVPIETGLARRIAVRRDEENDRVQLSLAGEPPNTRV